MKKGLLVLFTTVVVAGLFTMVACKKDTTTPNNNNNNNNNTPTACSGALMCFKLDGTDMTYSSDVVWKKLPAAGTNPARYRIYWEKSGGAENIEMDVFADAVGTYNVKKGSPYAVNDAGFQLWQSSGMYLVGVSGTVEITNIDNTNNTISGKFTITTEDQNNSNATKQVTEGNFVNVPLQ